MLGHYLELKTLQLLCHRPRDPLTHQPPTRAVAPAAPGEEPTWNSQPMIW